MKKMIGLLVLLTLVGCGGANAERAKEDVKGSGNDLSSGVGTKGKGLEDGVGTNKTDGGSGTTPTPSTDKK
jgi:hypothetical protein